LDIADEKLPPPLVQADEKLPPFVDVLPLYDAWGKLVGAANTTS
jgi:hypothetical protein